MSTKCRGTNSDGGVYVEAYSGVGSTQICTLAGRTDVRHIVTIKNLLLYDADISCEGLIQANPCQVEFSGGQSDISANKWSTTGSVIAGGEEQTFDYVGLKAAGLGSETVRTEVDVSWSQPNRKSTIPVSFRVSV